MKADLKKTSKMWDRYALIWDLFFDIFGRKDRSYRLLAVKKLELRRGNIVLDLGCGSGLNFEHIEKAVGEEGLIIGLDFSRTMLEKAMQKKVRNGWKNVNLVQGDAANFHFKNKIDGVVCTWSMVSIREYRKALRNSVESLKKGKRITMLDFRLRTDWVGRILNPLFEKVFRATNQDLTRRPWEDMEKLLRNVEIETHLPLLFFPLLPHYVASGLKE